MPNVHEGTLSGKGLNIGIVVSRFNEFVTTKLLQGALEALRQNEVAEDCIDVAWVPGAFEVPLVAKKMAESGRYDAVITLACVIRGGTAHFEYVAGGATTGIARASYETGVPVIFGVLTTDNAEQAMDRAGARHSNRGYDAALTAIETANLIKKLDERR